MNTQTHQTHFSVSYFITLFLEQQFLSFSIEFERKSHYITWFSSWFFKQIVQTMSSSLQWIIFTSPMIIITNVTSFKIVLNYLLINLSSSSFFFLVRKKKIHTIQFYDYMLFITSYKPWQVHFQLWQLSECFELFRNYFKQISIIKSVHCKLLLSVNHLRFDSCESMFSIQTISVIHLSISIQYSRKCTAHTSLIKKILHTQKKKTTNKTLLS